VRLRGMKWRGLTRAVTKLADGDRSVRGAGCVCA
jgi:hypothetical protein